MAAKYKYYLSLYFFFFKFYSIKIGKETKSNKIFLMTMQDAKWKELDDSVPNGGE